MGIINGLKTKNDLLGKLRSYSSTPDDENIRYKDIIKNALLKCPELLYALNEKEFESELFDEEGQLNVDNDGNPLGEWDRYFGENSNIRPFLYFPQTQTVVKNYLCYKVDFDDIPRANANFKKYTNITFTIFVHGQNAIDKLTGIPRHDLIASILRERFNWSAIFGMQSKLISSRESLTDNSFLTRTLVLEIEEPNSVVHTPYGEDNSYIINKEYWK